MQIDLISKNRWAERPLNQAITLSSEDSVTVTLDYRFAGAIPALNQALNIRFVNSVSGNYMAVGINPASTSSTSSIFKRTGDTNEGKFGAFIHDDAKETITLAITRILGGADSKAQFDVSWAGNPGGPISANPNENA